MGDTLRDLGVTPAYTSDKLTPGINCQLILTAYDYNSAGEINSGSFSKRTVREQVVVGW